MKPLVLIVEDEPPLQTLLAYNLRAVGYEVAQAYDAEEARLLLAERSPDLMVLDWMLPGGVSGLELCRQLRRNEETAALPIIMLTAKAEEADRLRGLDTGADDYVTKPFSMPELIARIKSVLRRIRPALVGHNLRHGDVLMDVTSHRVLRGQIEIHLSPTEFRLLRYLMEHPERVFTREQLLDAVWGQDKDVEPRTVDAAVRRLRRALNIEGRPDVLRTVRAEGYALAPASQLAEA